MTLWADEGLGSASVVLVVDSARFGSCESSVATVAESATERRILRIRSVGAASPVEFSGRAGKTTELLEDESSSNFQSSLSIARRNLNFRRRATFIPVNTNTLDTICEFCELTDALERAVIQIE